jgi:acetyltransferase
MTTSSPSLLRARVRPIRADDRDELSRFYAALSPESRFSRFHATTRGIGDEAASLLCGADHEHREGFVAEATGMKPGAAVPALVGHLCLEPSPSGLEMAIAVADDWQGQGIGRALLLAAVDWAAGHGIALLQASALSTNSAVLGLIASIGRPVRELSPVAGVVNVTIHVAGTRPKAA